MPCDFTNTTPIKATFPEAGKYTITLSLINLENNNNVITTNSFEVNVTSNALVENNTIDNGINNVEELPKTGVSIWEYVLCFVGVGIVLSIAGMYINRKK